MGVQNYLEDGKVGTASVVFRFFHITFRQLETIDLLHHFVGVNWPDAAAFLDIFVDDSLQLFFFNVINHNSKTNRYLSRRPTSAALNRTSCPVRFQSPTCLSVVSFE